MGAQSKKPWIELRSAFLWKKEYKNLQWPVKKPISRAFTYIEGLFSRASNWQAGKEFSLARIKHFVYRKYVATNSSSPPQGHLPSRSSSPGASITFWQPAFDCKIRAAIGKSLALQKSVIHELVKAEPRLDKAVVVTRFVEAILKRASLLSLERRETAICQVLQLDPSSTRDGVIKKLNQLATTSLPAWTSSSFWSQKIDPILLCAITNANQELEAAIRQIRSIHPSLAVAQIRERHGRYRSNQTDTTFRTVSASDWPLQADRLLRAAIATEIEAEADAIRRASKKYPEVRVRAIEQRARHYGGAPRTTANSGTGGWPGLWIRTPDCGT